MSTNTTQQLKQGYVSKLINSDPQLLDVTRPTPPRRGVSVWQLALLLGALGLVYTQSTVGLSNRFGELLRQVPPVPGCGLSVERDHEFVWGEVGSRVFWHSRAWVAHIAPDTTQQGANVGFLLQGQAVRPV